jgi:hypothetical protein
MKLPETTFLVEVAVVDLRLHHARRSIAYEGSSTMRLSVGLGALGVPDLALLMDLRRLRALSPMAARSDNPTETPLPGWEV